MSNSNERTPRPRVEAAGGYSVPRAATPIDLWLDANEGPMPPLEVLEARPPDSAHRRYPKKPGLEARLAERLGRRPEEVLVTAGGDEAIDRICRVFLGPGRNLIVPTPSFVMIGYSAKLSGAEVREVEWERPQFPVDDALRAVDDETGVFAIVSPNNPNGFVATRDEVLRVSRAVPQAVVLLDLAYVEFAEDDLSDLARPGSNIVGVRTFSKARGLAGVRVGYVFGDERWIGPLRAAGGPYPVSASSLALAQASLDHGDTAVAEGVASIRQHRANLVEACEELALEPTESHGNFALVKVDDGEQFRDAMAGMGIGVRAWPGDVRLGERSRISVPASTSDSKRLVHAVRTVRRPDAILFDVDGVFVDVRGSYRAAIIGTCAHFGVDVDLDDIVEMKARGDANNDWIVSQRLLREAGVSVDLEEVTEVFEDLYQGTENTEGLWRHEKILAARDWLESIQARGYKLGCVTGRPRRDASRFVEMAGFENLFGAMICMEDAERKPSPEPLRLAMKQLGAQTAWFLGDTVDDIRAARAAEALPIGVVAPGEPRDTVAPVLRAAGAGLVWDSVGELETWI